ncbi:hypothetical protein QBC40DRAFT_273628 [Triangularia verruculosa]|uniref:Uncharacterized protein n=1 Tax=Triangularia verruculosa TaxID=2587418 RepID=A0AAN7B0H2_9PEZI|nr:hypothetical protein QBC40DRAFT_273628 [Triangularia verruculosa]
METNSADELCLIDPNPDVVGVGIRVSLYVLALSYHIFSYVFNSAELSSAIESSLGVTGLALFLTAVITTARQSLGLFHALCVFHLLGIVGLSAQPRGRYPTGVVRKVVFMAFYVVVMAGSLAYLIYVFATAPAFGEQTECNDKTVYVLFGVNIPATSAGLRWTLVAGLGILLLGFAMWLLFVTCVAVDALFGRKVPGDVFGAQDEHPGNPRKRQPPYQLLSYLAGTIYLAVMLELMIQRNALAPGLEEWSFGQVLAMTMLIGPLIELASLVLGRIDGVHDNQLVQVSGMPVQRRSFGRA